MKKIIAAIGALFLGFAAFAGDAASFDEIGFSDDGNYFIFGQYGKTDQKYQAWAEIYTVDVEKNDFVKDDVFKAKPGENGELSGRDVYEQLRAKSEWKLSKYNAKPSEVKKLLYLREAEKKAPTEEIDFRDFEGSVEPHQVFYTVRLVPTYEGTGKNCQSKFYIDLTKKDENGNILAKKKVGTPDFKRKGIVEYQIDKIISDKEGKSLVFIVQKKMEDSTGTSIRYMVETVK